MQQDYYPDPLIPGKFNQKENGFGEDKLKFLSPSNWVYHPGIVENVINGKYEKIKPYSGEFVMTLNCTHRCESPCPYTQQKQIAGCWNENDFMNPLAHMQTLDYAKRLLDKIKQAGVKGLIFTGGGEPTLNKYLGGAMKYADEIGIDTVLYTNLVGLSNSQLEEILDANPLLIRGSLNAVSKEPYNKLHNPLNKVNSHEKALKNVKRISRGVVDKPNIDFGIAFVINEINKNDLENSAYELRDILIRNNARIDFATFRPTFDYVGGEQINPEVVDEIYEKVEKKVRPVLESIGIKCNNVKPRYESLKKDTKNFTACRASGLYVELSPNGDLHLCCDRNAHPDWAFGNLNRNSLEEIFEGNARRVMIESVNEDNCSGCPPGCKPQMTNNQFEEVERKRALGEMQDVIDWVNAWQEYPKPKMVNF